MTRGRFSRAAIAAALTVAGCGYHIAGRDSTLPKSIHVIAVPALENKTTSYRLEQKLTAATVHEFLAKTPYKVVSNPEDGDAVLRGKVLSLEAVPLLSIRPRGAQRPCWLPSSARSHSLRAPRKKSSITPTILSSATNMKSRPTPRTRPI